MVPKEDVNSAEDFIDLIDHCLSYEVYEHHLPYVLTVSVGYAYCTGPDESRKKLLEQADQSMFEVKAKAK